MRQPVKLLHQVEGDMRTRLLDCVANDVELAADADAGRLVPERYKCVEHVVLRLVQLRFAAFELFARPIRHHLLVGEQHHPQLPGRRLHHIATFG